MTAETKLAIKAVSLLVGGGIIIGHLLGRLIVWVWLEVCR